MTSDTENKNGEGKLLLRRQAIPAPVYEELKQTQESATQRFKNSVKKVFRSARAEFGEDATRLREGSVRSVEAEGSRKTAEARKVEAEAELIFAQADQIKLSNAIKAHSVLKELELSSTDIEAAEQRVAQAIMTIIEKGGGFYLDEEENP